MYRKMFSLFYLVVHLLNLALSPASLAFAASDPLYSPDEEPRRGQQTVSRAHPGLPVVAPVLPDWFYPVMDIPSSAAGSPDLSPAPLTSSSQKEPAEAARPALVTGNQSALLPGWFQDALPASDQPGATLPAAPILPTWFAAQPAAAAAPGPGSTAPTTFLPLGFSMRQPAQGISPVPLPFASGVPVLPPWFANTASDLFPAEHHNTILEESVTVAGPVEINQCQSVSYVISATNDAVTTTNVVITSSMPAGFTPSQQVFSFESVVPSQTITATATFNASCSAVSGQNVTTIGQDGYHNFTLYKDFVVNPGAITLQQSPSIIPAGVGDLVTYTITARNTGYGLVSNARVTETLGSGLSYRGGITATSFVSIPVGATRSFTVSAEIVDCAGLTSVAYAVWGCPGQTCQAASSQSSVDLLIETPLLSYTPAFNDVDYIRGQSTFSMPVNNIGQGNAYTPSLAVNFGFLQVVASSAPYSGGAFRIPQTIPPGGSFLLTYTLSLPAPPCGYAGKTGGLLYEPDYYDECGNLYYPPVKAGAYRISGAIPGIATDIIANDEVYASDILSYQLMVTTTNISGSILITDSFFPGCSTWEPINLAGGSMLRDADGNITVTWTTTQSLWKADISFQSSGECPGACSCYGKIAWNNLAASAVDLQECPVSSSSTEDTAIQFKGVLENQQKEVSPYSSESCTTRSYTNTYQFVSTFNVTPTWQTLVFTDALDNQEYISGSAVISISDGVQACTATYDVLSSSPLVIGNISPSCGISLPGATLVVQYQAEAGNANTPCSDARFYDWSLLSTGVTGNGACLECDLGAYEEGVWVDIRPPAVEVSFTDLPPYVASCGIYDLTMFVHRASSNPAYDVEAVFITDTYRVVSVKSFSGLTPVLTTTDSTGYHWFYDDQFTSATDAAVLLQVQLECSASGGNTPTQGLVYFDDHCADDETYDRTCSSGGSGTVNPKVLAPSPILYKYPEKILASSDLVTWTLTAINSGSGVAYGVTLTDTLGSGLHYKRSSIDSTFGSAAGVTPITSSQVITWSNLTILPGEEYSILFTAEINGCSDLTNAFAGSLGCQGQTCLSAQPVRSVVQLPDTLMANTNQVLTPIQTCATRAITATVRNAGLLSVYQARITETLSTGLNYIPGSSEYVVGTGTTPPASGWLSTTDPVEAGSGVLAWTPAQVAELARLYPGQTIWVRFDVGVSCAFTGGNITIRTNYQDACGVTEDSLPSSYLTQAVPPDILAVKRGRNLDSGSSWGSITTAEPGDQVQWAITLTNRSSTPALNLVVTDSLPTNTTYLSAWPAPAFRSGQVITWLVGTLNQTTWSALITTTVNDEICTPVDTAEVFTATWGCDDGCRLQAVRSSLLRTRPLASLGGLSTSLASNELESCGGAITLTLQNDGSPAYSVLLTDTLPSGFSYSETLYTSRAPDASPAAGSSQPIWGWNSLPTGVTTVTFSLRPGNNQTCSDPAGGNNRVDLFYDDICISSGPYRSSSTTQIDVIRPSISMNLTPASQISAPDDQVAWSIRMTNTGDGPAHNLLVTATLGSGFSPSGTTTWAIPELEANGGVFTQSLTATALVSGSNQLVVDLLGSCGSGCTYADLQKQGYISLVQDFHKYPAVQTGTIGSLAVFTFTARLPDQDANYEDLVFTDSLPVGLGYVSSVLTVTSDEDASQAGPFTSLITTPVQSPALYQSGSVVWTPGDRTGSVRVDGVITAVIQNILTNQAGDSLLNALDFSYVDNGLSYTFTDTARVDIVEPSITTLKNVTPVSGLEAGKVVTYTLRLSNTGGSTAQDVTVEDTLPGPSGALALDQLVPANTCTYFNGISTSSIPASAVQVGNQIFLDGSPAGNWDIPSTNPDAYIECTYRVNLNTPIYINGSYTNSADADWTSQDGANINERNYNDTPGYTVDGSQDTDTAVFSIGAPTLSKSDGGKLNATIGETIYYTLTINSPLGTLRGLVVTDTLPTGLFYVTPTVAIAGLSGAVTPTIIGANTGSAATSLVWNLGDTLVSSSPARITFQAILDNVASNQRNPSTTRTNTGYLLHRSAAGVLQTKLSATDNVIVVEPELTITKSTLTPLPKDAGDVVTYSVAINNPNIVRKSTAYNVIVSDTLPANLALVPGSLSISGASVYTDSSAANTLRVMIASIAVGGSASLQYRATLSSAVQPNTTIQNTARVSWTSLPGTPAYERNGSDGPGGALNDYAATSTKSITTQAPQSSKSLNATSLANTPNLEVNIGEILTYTVLVTVPEGTTSNLVVTDTLDSGLAFVGCSSISASSAALTGTVQFSAACAAPDVRSSGEQVGFHLGNLTNSDTNNNLAEIISLVYRAVVLNTAGNQAGTLLNNSAQVFYGSSSLTAAQAANVTVVEPNLQIKKVGAPSSGDAGDVITYTLRITNAIATNDTPAFNLSLTDTLPANLSYIPGSLAHTGGYTPTLVDESAAPQLGVSWDVFTQGLTSTLQFRARLLGAVTPGERITNTAYIKGTSLPGASSFVYSSYNSASCERSGNSADCGGVLNDYKAQASAYLTVNNVQPVKTLVASSETHTPDTQLTIGEIARYRLKVQLPEGSSPGFQLVDLIPPGMVFLNDGSARIAFVCNSGADCVSSSSLSGAGLIIQGSETSTDITPTLALAGADISPVSFAENTDVTFSLGNLTNQDSDPDQEFVVLEFNALVMNVAANSDGRSLPNSYQVWINSALRSTSNIVTVTAINPALSLKKTLQAASAPDAGDTLTYTLRFTNTSTVAAFNLVLTDTLDSYLTYQNAQFSLPVTSTFTHTAPAGQVVTGLVDQLYPGAVGVMIIAARLNANVPNGQTIPNSASLSFTSLPGAQGSLPNPTGSSTPGGSGSSTGERSGLNSGASPNTYYRTASASSTLATPAFNKVLQYPADTDYTIGELVGFDLIATLPEGVTRRVYISDTLPANLSLSSFQVITTAASSSGNLALDYSGSLSSAPVYTQAFGTVTFYFGDITTNDDNQAGSNAFILRLFLRVDDVAANQAGDTRTNQARLGYSNPNSGARTVLGPYSVNIALVEPQLQLSKSIPTSPSPADAGGVAGYRLVITNPSGPTVSSGYEVNLTDTLPSMLALITSSVTIASNPTGCAAGATSSASSGSALLVFILHLPAGCAATIDYNAQLNAATQPLQSVTNTADLVWSSLLGNDPYERHHGDALYNSTTLPDDYERQAGASFTTSAPSLGKSLLSSSLAATPGSQATIGEVVTYSLAVTLPEGSTPSLVITDSFSSGLFYLPGSAISDTTGFNGALAPWSISSLGSQVIMHFLAPVSTAGDNDPANNTFHILLPLRPADVPGNRGLAPQTTLTNSAVMRPGSGPLYPAGPVSITVVEPQVHILKQLAPASAAANDWVTVTLWVSNTGSSPAYDMVIQDPLSDLNFSQAQALTTPAGYNYAKISSPPTTTVEYRGGPLLPGVLISFTFSAQVAGAITPGKLITNTAAITQVNTLPGIDPYERQEPGAESQAYLNSTAPDLAIFKSDGQTVITPGQTLVYTLTITNAPGARQATGVVISDTLPAGTSFFSASHSGAYTPSTRTVTWPAFTLDGGSSASRMLTVTVDNPAAGGIVTLTNVARVHDDGAHGADPTPEDNRSQDVDTLLTSFDLQLEKTDFGASVEPGGLLTYTLFYSNVGDVNLSGVRITETVPQYTSQWPVQGGSTWNCTPGNGAGSSCTYDIGSLAGGSSGSVQFTVQLDFLLTEGVTQVLNTAVISDDHSSGADPIPENNFANETTPITNIHPDLKIWKSDGGVSAHAGDVVTYTVYYTNSGSIAARNVTLTESVPTHTTYVGVGWSCSPDPLAGSLCTWNVGQIEGNGGSGSAEFSVQVDQPILPGVTLITNTVYIDDDHSQGVDPTPEDNQSVDHTPILSNTVELQIHKSHVTAMPDGEVFAGGLITYTLVYTNAGGLTATGVMISETVPASTTAVTAVISAGWLCSPDLFEGSLCTWSVGALASGITGSVTFTVQLTSSLPASVTQILNAAIIADDRNHGAETNTADNQTQDTTPVKRLPLAVSLHTFQVYRIDGEWVHLAWSTLQEMNLTGFNLYRSTISSLDQAERIAWTPARGFESNGMGADYQFADLPPAMGTWYYWLTVMDTTGNETLPGPDLQPLMVRTGGWKLYLPVMLR